MIKMKTVYCDLPKNFYIYRRDCGKFINVSSGMQISQTTSKTNAKKHVRNNFGLIYQALVSKFQNAPQVVDNILFVDVENFDIDVQNAENKKQVNQISADSKKIKNREIAELTFNLYNGAIKTYYVGKIKSKLTGGMCWILVNDVQFAHPFRKDKKYYAVNSTEEIRRLLDGGLHKIEQICEVFKNSLYLNNIPQTYTVKWLGYEEYQNLCYWNNLEANNKDEEEIGNE